MTYNKKNKSLSNKRVFVKLDKEDTGIVDGMTVDSEGFIWSAIWFSSKVLRFDPDGKLEREISFPATQTSCPAFGGKDLNELYVTTANSGTGEKPSGVEPKNYESFWSNFLNWEQDDLDFLEIYGTEIMGVCPMMIR